MSYLDRLRRLTDYEFNEKDEQRGAAFPNQTLAVAWEGPRFGWRRGRVVLTSEQWVLVQGIDTTDTLTFINPSRLQIGG